MMLKAFLQGKPLRHPLHPALVHFPIGLFILTLLLDAAIYFGIASNDLSPASLYTLSLGIVMGVLAAISGLADRSSIRLDHPARKTVNIHMTLNLAAIGLFIINLLLRSNQQEEAQISIVQLLLSAVGVGIILVSGYLGGTMVYDDGVGVGRHRRRTDLPIRTLNVSIFERGDGWVVVCNADEIQEGESLRVDWNGNIIAVARVGGEVYAFQEFCTHRYGPLSEGRLFDRQVECPWHRSCFDMRTGKVTQGPAKMDLKTYSARIRNGKILIAD